jgi:hypothetical protein
LENDASPQLSAGPSFLPQLNVGLHLRRGGSAAREENTKNKVVIPYLQHLGWSLLDDLYFEDRGADLVIRQGGGRTVDLIVEVKPWEHRFSRVEELQLLRYAIDLECPWVLYASGDRFRLFHALTLSDVNPIALIEAHLDDIRLGRDDLEPHLRRSSSVRFGVSLRPLAVRQLRASTRADTWDDLQLHWVEYCKRNCAARTTPQKMNLQSFQECVQALPRKSGEAFRALLNAMTTLEGDFQEFAKVEGKSKSQGIHLRYELPGRTKWLGVLGLYPMPKERPNVSCGYGGWKNFGITRAEYQVLHLAVQQLKKVPSRTAALETARVLRALVQKAHVRFLATRNDWKRKP